MFLNLVDVGVQAKNRFITSIPEQDDGKQKIVCAAFSATAASQTRDI